MLVSCSHEDETRLGKRLRALPVVASLSWLSISLVSRCSTGIKPVAAGQEP